MNFILHVRTTKGILKKWQIRKLKTTAFLFQVLNIFLMMFLASFLAGEEKRLDGVKKQKRTTKKEGWEEKKEV